MKTHKGQMPKEHMEKKVSDVSVANQKYASKDSMGNPEDLKRSVDSLSSYVRKNKMKY